MSGDPRTRDYVARQGDAGLSSREILQAQAGIAREVFRLLTTPVAVPGVDDLRPLHQAKHQRDAAAKQLGVWPTTISELERGVRRNDELAQT